MVRRVSAAAFAMCLVVIATMPFGCKPKDCTMLGCSSTHAVIDAHVKVAVSTLLAAKTTVCWRDVCSELVAADGAGKSSEISFAALGPLVGTASVSAEGSEAARLHLELSFFTRGRDGDFVYTRQANGDRYRVTVVDSAGKELFAAEREVTYEESYPNGPDCDPDPCRRVAFELFAP